MLKKEKTIKSKIKFILISLCTCKRPKLLKQALESVNGTINVESDIKIEILVVDNDKEQSAKETIDEYKSRLNFPIHYYVEEKRGISNARNCVLEKAIKLGASHIYFFDDDEILTKDCIANHIKIYEENPKAIIVAGPTVYRFEEYYPKYIKKHMVFKQNTTKKTGSIRKNCATGNVFFPTTLIKDYGLRFSNKFVFMGGEDGDFFTKASNLGFTIVWNNNSTVYEYIPAARANLKYILRKCYYNGYSGAHQKFENNNKYKIKYLIKNILLLIANTIMTIISIFLGKTIFFNALGTTVRTIGKIDGTVSMRTYDFYREIYGE